VARGQQPGGRQPSLLAQGVTNMRLQQDRRIAFITGERATARRAEEVDRPGKFGGTFLPT